MHSQAGRTLISAEVDDCFLLKAIAAQDQQALQQFYNRHASTVYGFVKRRLSLEYLAEEVTNDTFIQVWRSAGSFEERSSARTWLLAIAKYKVIDALRTQYRTTNNEQLAPDGDEPQSLDPAPGPYEQVLSRQKGTHLIACFEALSPDHRESLHLSIVEGMTFSEIAKVIDAPSNTVGTRIHHAKQKLKACLESRLGVGEVV